MSRLLRTLLLGLLKLVLQLIILVVTGKWVHIGARQPANVENKGGGRRGERVRPAAGAQGARGKRPLFERRQRGETLSRSGDSSGGPATLEELWSTREADLPSLETSIEEGAGSWAQRQRAPKRRGRQQPPVPAAAKRSSLASALQDPRAIRRAILVGSAIAPRRR